MAIVVIAILIGLLIVAVTAAIRGARRAGEQGVATGIQTGVATFQTTFENRLPPLVYDGDPIELVTAASTPRISGGPGNREGPVYRGNGSQPPVVATLQEIYVDGGSVFLTGHEPPDGTGQYDWLFDPARDPRYSKFSLPMFLGGVLGEDVDGVSGPGMRLTFTNRRGWSMGGTSEVRGVFYQPSNETAIVSSYVSVDEFREHGQAAGGNLPAGASDASPDRTAFVNPAGVAFRYYRWEPNAEQDVGTGAGNPPLAHLNIPRILLDPRTWSDPNEPGEMVPVELRSARYAIVGSGPNGLFGTEPIDLLRSRLGVGPGVAEDAVRFQAWDDNVVRVGVGQ